MKKLFAFVFIMLFLIHIPVKADEGMWLLTMINKLNYGKMKKMGFNLTPEEIYSINNSSIKDAVVGLGSVDYPSFRFSCTSELISPDGLLLTNHHCGYDEIQSHSSVENNYVEDGFWAKSREQELPNPGKTASFLIRMEDVTDQVLANITYDITEDERETKIQVSCETIEEEAIEDTHYSAIVKDFFNGNRYYLLVYETYYDVRLVGAPPSSIGKYGGDTDNWMWPRHTGDFSMFRVYTGPDGKPAEYSEDNIPLRSKHFFPISLKGVEKDDFSMIMGFPGTTDRYLTSWGVQETMDVTNDIRVKVRTKKLNIIKEDMDADEKTFIQYTSKYNQSSNYWKYSIGQNQGLRRLKVIERKQEIEEKLSQWINADEERKKKYGQALNLINEAYDARSTYQYAMEYLNEAIFEGPECIMFAYNSFNLFNALTQSPGDLASVSAETESLREKANDFFKDYNSSTDKKLMTELFKLYYENVEADFQPVIFSMIESDYNGDFEAFANEVYSKSVFTDSTRFYEMLDKPLMESTIFGGTDIIPFAESFSGLYHLLKEQPDSTNLINEEIETIKQSLITHFNEYYSLEEDQKKFENQYATFYKEVPQDQQPDIFREIEGKFKGDVKKFAETIFKKSIFADKKKIEKFLKKPKLKTLEKDLAFKTMLSVYPKMKTVVIQDDLTFQTMYTVLITYFTINGQTGDVEKKLEKGRRLFLAALMEMDTAKTYYPDANSTMRLTYGSVGDYKPRDAVRYKYFTTLKGVMEKEDSTNQEFIVDSKLKELYKEKDYGRYGRNDTMFVCFTTNTDITGGNSGSPVINGDGELIGIAFDGNWEAMSGDIAFENELQKTISVDIRYVLFVIDKLAGATNLIDEMVLKE